jgi:hypothetical protein
MVGQDDLVMVAEGARIRYSLDEARALVNHADVVKR